MTLKDKILDILEKYEWLYAKEPSGLIIGYKAELLEELLIALEEHGE